MLLRVVLHAVCDTCEISATLDLVRIVRTGGRSRRADARVAKQVDAAVLNTAVLRGVGVQVPPRALVIGGFAADVVRTPYSVFSTDYGPTRPNMAAFFEANWSSAIEPASWSAPRLWISSIA